MSVGAKRSPTRLLSSANIGLAFPGELLIDPSTGNFIYVTDAMGQVEHKKPGTLTVTQGQSTLVDHADLSGDINFSIPDVQMPTFTANRVLVSNGTGGMAASSISTTLLDYLTGLSGNIQDQLDAKSNSGHNHDGTYLPISGTAVAANKLATARNITIGSAVKTFDGTENIGWSLTEIGAAAANHNHDSAYLAIDGTAVSASKLATAHRITIGNFYQSFDGTTDLTFTLSQIGAAASNHNHDGVYLPVSGTAAAATKLATARTITIGSWYQDFDGTSDISFTLSQIGAAAIGHNHDGVYLPVSGTAAAATKLATARTITIGNYSQTFDGSSNISFTLAQIGAAATNHTHFGYLSTSGGTISGNLSVTGTLSAGTLSGVRKDYTGTLSTSWTGSAAPYTQAVTVSGILSTDRPILDMVCSGTYATDQSREEGWLNIYRAVTAANKITFYAHEKPTVSIPFYAQVTR